MLSVNKKDQLWNHFISCAFLENSFPNGITRKRLNDIKNKVFQDNKIWEEMQRHGIENCSPEYLQYIDKPGYEHMVGNFWGMIVSQYIR